MSVAFDDVARAVAGIPYMSPEQGRIVCDHILATRPAEVLELGTGHGVSAAYLAAGLAAVGAGRLTTVDHAQAAYDPPAEEVLARAGVADRVTIVREFSSYTWWLKELVRARSDRAGNVEPLYDFVYIDGAKSFTIGGLTAVLVEKLLRPGGWLLLDDLDWRHTDSPDREATDGVVQRELSARERSEPHLRAVFDLVIAQHPSFTELRIQDEWWGWARKAPGEPRRYSLEISRPIGVRVSGAARRLRRGARRAFRRARL